MWTQGAEPATELSARRPPGLWGRPEHGQGPEQLRSPVPESGWMGTQMGWLQGLASCEAELGVKAALLGALSPGCGRAALGAADVTQKAR